MTEGWQTRNPTKLGSYQPAHPVSSARHDHDSSSLRHGEVDARLDECVQLAPGMFVVWQRRPWVIAAITEVPPDRWGEKAVASGEKLPQSDRLDRTTWADRPIYLHLVPELADIEEFQPTWVAAAASDTWTVLPKHYAVCVRCQELPPCRHELGEDGEEEDSQPTTGGAAVLKFPYRPHH